MASGPNQPNPFATNQPGQPQYQQPGSNNVIWIILGVALVALLMCGGLMVALLVPAVSAARQAAQRASQQIDSAYQLKTVGLALHNYHSAYKQLPPTSSTNSAGEVVHGWRLTISPFAEGRRQFESFDREQAWDSAANAPVINDAPSAFQANNGMPGQTNIFAIVSDEGVFPTQPDAYKKFRDVLDGLANTAIAIQVPGRYVAWTSDENLTPDEAYAAITSLANGETALLLMGDGATVPVVNSIQREFFDALVTREGGDMNDANLIR